MKKLTIVYRYCDKEIPASGIPRSQIFGSKKELWTKCITSIFNELKSFRLNKYKDLSLELHIVEDPVSNKYFSNTINEGLDSLLNLPNTIIKTHKLPTTGNAASIGYSLDIGYASDTDAIFFLEDDYLFNTDSFKLIIEGYQELSQFIRMPVCIHPVDYIDRYTRTPLDPAFVLTTRNHHWRTISNTTGTVVLPKVALMYNWDNITKFRNYQILPNCDEDKTINTTYKKYPCLSPIPTLAHHMQYDSLLSPFYDTNFKRIFKE